MSEWECELAGQIWFAAEFLSDMLFGTKFCPSTCMTVCSGQRRAKMALESGTKLGLGMVRLSVYVYLNLWHFLARYMVWLGMVCMAAGRDAYLSFVGVYWEFCFFFAVVLWAVMSACGSCLNCRTKPLYRICKECRGAPLLGPALRRKLVHGRDPNMAFLREKRSRLSPVPAARSLSLNAFANMSAKVSFEHEERRERVFRTISFFPAAMEIEVFFLVTSGAKTAPGA